MNTISPSRRRRAVVLIALAVVSCFLPSEPTERITFEFRFTSPLRVPLGGSIQPVVTVKAGDRELTNAQVTLQSLNGSVVQIDPTGRRLFGVKRGMTSVRVAYTGATGTVDTTFDARTVVTSVSVSPPTFTISKLGDSVQLTAFADSNKFFPPSEFTWSSDNPAIATVSPSGMVKARDEGNVRIWAELDNVQGLAQLGVLQAASAVRIVPERDTLRWLTSTKRFVAVALDSNGAILQGAKAHWTSLDPAIASVDAAAGIATADSAGTARIVAQVGPAADTALVVVKQVALLVFVRPGLDTLTAIQDTGRIVASAADSALKAIPDFAVDSWSSEDPAIATIDGSGLVTAHANGIVLVTAKSGTESAFATIVVRQVVARAQIQEDAVSLDGEGATKQLTVSAVDKNGYPVPGAGGIDWRSHFSLVATVDANGLVTAHGNGRTKVTASVGGQSDTTTVTVTGAPQELIAFQSGYGIEAVRSDGSLRTLLIPNPSCDDYYYCSTSLTDPAWSPDGTRLAYVQGWWDYGACYYGCSDVYTALPDGSGAVNLTSSVSGARWHGDPAWSPDGVHIAFASTSGSFPQSIYVMDADGSGIRRVTTVVGYNPKWSPDGNRIVFDDGNDILVVNVDGTGLVKLPIFGGVLDRDVQPAWSPDGTQIAFVSNRAGFDDIWLMNADGSGLTNLTVGLEYLSHPTWTQESTPAWSPDGSRISFAATHCFNNIGQISCQASLLYIVNRDGTGLKPLQVEGYNPTWNTAGSLGSSATLNPSRSARIRR